MASETARDAILYIPSITEAQSGGALEGAARRIAEALDRQSVACYTVSALQEQKITEQRAARLVTISRNERGKEVPVADVYEVGYTDALGGGFRTMKPIWQAIVILGVLLGCLPRLLSAWRRPTQEVSHKLQVVYAGAAFILLAAYLPVVIGAAFGSLMKVVPGIADYHLALGGFRLGWKEFTSSMQDLVVAMTALGLFTTFNLKQGLANFAAEYTPILRYLAMGDRQGAVQGSVVSVLDHILDQESAGGQRYERIHIIAYSFGTMVALDTLFARLQPSPLFGRVNTLVTIACPFDFVRTYWSDYFDGRCAPASHIDWWNVYDPLDVLSSDFIDAPGKQNARQVGIGPGNAFSPTNLPPFGPRAAGWLDWVLLVGFRRHSQYWDRLTSGDVNCFDLIVPNLYPASALPPAPGPSAAAPAAAQSEAAAPERVAAPEVPPAPAVPAPPAADQASPATPDSIAPDRPVGPAGGPVAGIVVETIQADPPPLQVQVRRDPAAAAETAGGDVPAQPPQ